MSSRKANQIPVAMRQATVKSPSALHEVYTSGTATMSRSKSRIQLVLHDEPVIDKPSKAVEEVELAPDTNCTPEVCDMAEKLKTQVADLSLFLEEERLMHKDTQRRAEELLKDKMSQLNCDHKAALLCQQQDYERKMESMKAQYQHQLVTERMELNSAIAKLKTEMEILSGAFHTYKSQTQMSHEGDLKDWEETLTSNLRREKESEKKELENLLRYDHNIEMNKLERKHQNKLNEQKHEHKKDVEMVRSRYADHEGDLQELKDTKEKLQDVISQLSTATARSEAFEQQLYEIKMKYSDSKQQLLNQESQIAERVKDIEAKYKDQNDKLLEANSNLRVQYLKKCEDLFEQTAQTEVNKNMTSSGPQVKKRLPEH